MVLLTALMVLLFGFSRAYGPPRRMEVPTLTSNQQASLHRIQVRPILPSERAGIDFPHLGQAFLIQRVTINLKDDARRDDCAFGLTQCVSSNS